MQPVNSPVMLQMAIFQLKIKVLAKYFPLLGAKNG